MGLVCGCQLVTEAIDIEAMRRAVENLSYDAVVSYAAELSGAAPTVYSTNEERALLQMFAVAEEAANRWDANVAVIQRLGELFPGDSSFACIVACNGYENAFDCCRYVTMHVQEGIVLEKT